MDKYEIGDLVELNGVFTDPNNSNAPIDPDSLSIIVIEPSGLETTYVYPADITKLDVGVYRLNIEAFSRGLWCATWQSSGTGQAGERQQWVVE